MKSNEMMVTIPFTLKSNKHNEDEVKKIAEEVLNYWNTEIHLKTGTEINTEDEYEQAINKLFDHFDRKGYEDTLTYQVLTQIFDGLESAEDNVTAHSIH